MLVIVGEVTEELDEVDKVVEVRDKKGETVVLLITQILQATLQTSIVIPMGVVIISLGTAREKRLNVIIPRPCRIVLADQMLSTNRLLVDDGERYDYGIQMK